MKNKKTKKKQLGLVVTCIALLTVMVIIFANLLVFSIPGLQIPLPKLMYDVGLGLITGMAAGVMVIVLQHFG